MTHKYAPGVEGRHGLDMDVIGERWHILTGRWCRPDRKHGHAVLENPPGTSGAGGKKRGCTKTLR